MTKANAGHAETSDPDGLMTPTTDTSHQPQIYSSSRQKHLAHEHIGNNRDRELFLQHISKSRTEQANVEYSDQELFLSTGINTLDIMPRTFDEIFGEKCDKDDDYDEESSEAATLAVASAEEYAAKIIKLQQACLIPLKEDLADWLNKILKTSRMTTDNFMDKLDNGVIICRLAKIISLWCKQQIESQEQNTLHDQRNRDTDIENAYGLDSASSRSRSQINNQTTSNNLNAPLRSSATSHSTNCLIKTSASATSLNNGSHLSFYHSNHFLNNLIRMHHIKIWEEAKCRTFYARDNVCNFIKWSADFGVNQSVLFESDDLVSHANPRQVVLCLLDVARIAYVKYNFTEAPGLVKFEQELDKELKSGQNRINFVLRDGSVLALEKNIDSNSDSLCDASSSATKKAMANKASDGKPSLKPSQCGRASIGDATDELIMRYCRHKEEEAARKRQQEDMERLAQEQQEQQKVILEPVSEFADSSLIRDSDLMLSDKVADPTHENLESEPLIVDGQSNNHLEESNVTSTTDLKSLDSNSKIFLADHGRVDSLDSGEGPTESASTAHSCDRHRDSSQTVTAIDYNIDSTERIVPNPRRSKDKYDSSSPTPASQPTTTSNSVTENSDLSSSRSSLLSNQDCNNSTSNYGRQITSDLDGKVMRIAKSYYGKKATRDVTRLSEGKYKIADRIVFVRLLKGHRVMVRIGGGWDTLENFLFRHKSDPTQVIDPDNLLPLETKMSLEKSAAQVTPKSTPMRSPASTKLPSYRRSSSASSTNLSLSNLSFSNLSLASSHNTPSRQALGKGGRLNSTMIGSSYNSSPAVDRAPRRQIPCLLIHKGKPVSRTARFPLPAYSMDSSRHQTTVDPQQQPQRYIPQAPSAQVTTPSKSLLKKTQNHSNNRALAPQQMQSSKQAQNPRVLTTPTPTPTRSILLQRPLASSRAPTFSAANLYPATLITNNNRSRI